jgi:hypothetical protein
MRNKPAGSSAKALQKITTATDLGVDCRLTFAIIAD